MVEEGVISDIKDGKIIVNMKRRPACGSCGACGMAENKTMEIVFENTIGAVKGDRVHIELDDSAILKGAFFFYVIPLIGLMAGIMFGTILARAINATMPEEIIAALSGITAMLSTLIFVRMRSTAGSGHKPKISKAT
ncbi:MAG: SoxR reducing system RseC family protein [Candidatus Omnitrophica bacterium]|nr:SoxR reducing system RseC family protein [Candidatus Omnitrophota bacterium]